MTKNEALALGILVLWLFIVWFGMFRKPPPLPPQVRTLNGVTYREYQGGCRGCSMPGETCMDEDDYFNPQCPHIQTAMDYWNFRGTPLHLNFKEPADDRTAD